MLVCYGSMTCLAISANLPPVYLTTFAETFGGPGGLSAEQLGRIPAVIFGTTVLGILFSGPLADRRGGKLLALAGLVLTAAGLCLLAAAQTYTALLVAGGIMGFGAGILDMILSPIVCALQPLRRARALNHLHAFYCIGALGTVIAASAALRLGISWRVTMLLITAVPTAMFIGFLTLTIPPFIASGTVRTPTRGLLSRPLFLALLVGITLCGAIEQGMSQWLPAYAERALGYSKSTGGFALAAFSVGMIIGRVSLGSAAHRLRPIPLMLIACAGCVLAYGVACFVPVPPLALAGCISVGVAVSCLWPTALSLAADALPQGGATMFSLMTAGGNVGCFVMPWLIGIVAEATSLTTGLAIAMTCPVLLAMILAGIAMRAKTA